MSLSRRVIQQVKINNIISGIAKCWKIKHPALYYTDNIQKVITTIKQQPVFIICNYFKPLMN